MQIIQRHKNILYLLCSQQRVFSSIEISNFVGVSVRTVKSDIKQIDALAADYGIRVIAVPSRGYSIKVIDEMQFSKSAIQLKIFNSYHNPNSSHKYSSRTIKITQFLIVQDAYTSTDKLESYFYLTESGIHLEMNSIKHLLAGFKLQLVSRQSVGYKITGNEFNKRMCMLMLYEVHYHEAKLDLDIPEFYFYFNEDQMATTDVRHKFLHCLRVFKYHLNDEFTQSIAKYLTLQFIRHKHSYPVSFSKEEIALLKKFTYQYSLAQRILTDLYSDIDLIPSLIDEIYSLEILLLIWADIDSEDSSNTYFDPIEDEINQLGIEITHQVISAFKLDFSGGNQAARIMKSSLTLAYLKIKLNCISFDIRGSLLLQNQALSPLSSFLADEIIRYLENKYQTSFAEFSRLIMIFGMTNLMNSVEIPVSKKRVLVCSGGGLDSGRQIIRKLTAEFGNYIESIQVIELYEGRDFKTSDYDLLILTNIAEYVYKYDWPVFSFDINKNDEQLGKIYTVLSNPSDSILAEFVYSQKNLAIEVKQHTPEYLLSTYLKKTTKNYVSEHQIIFFFDTWTDKSVLKIITPTKHIKFNNRTYTTAIILNTSFSYNLRLLKIIDELCCVLARDDKALNAVIKAKNLKAAIHKLHV